MAKKDHLLRHAGHPPPFAIIRPALGQIERPVDQDMTVAAGIAEKDADLAVFDAPGRARVLALHAHRLRALLDEPGLIEHQHGTHIAEMFNPIRAQIIAHLIGIPAHPGKEILNPIRARIAGRLRQPFLRSTGAKSPFRYETARRRGSTRRKRGDIRSTNPSSPRAQSAASSIAAMTKPSMATQSTT